MKHINKLVFSTDHGKLYCGDALSVLKSLKEKSIQCCITSPPYWGLRDYKTKPLIWNPSWNISNEDIECKHVWGDIMKIKICGKIDESYKHLFDSPYIEKGRFCKSCGSWEGQLGLEPTPDLYVSHLVQVFNELKRILRNDGTLWVNMGDSYAGGSGTGSQNIKAIGLKRKDLIGIPWKLAFALQADGWYLRQDIIWQKGNCMVESAYDRCTRNHEYIFLLTKQPKYFFDYEAIKEKAITLTHGSTGPKGRMFPQGFTKKRKINKDLTRIKRSVWSANTKTDRLTNFAIFPEELIIPCMLAGTKKDDVVIDPFMGSGTVAALAEKLKRNWIGSELSKENCDKIKQKVSIHSLRRKASLGLI